MAKYTRLCYAERKRIEQLKSEGKGVRAIARILNRSPSSISYELNRRCTFYNASTAQRDATYNQKLRGKKSKITGPLEAMILYLLIEVRCSPEQISGQLRRSYPDARELQVSPEAIYLWIYAHPERRLLTTFFRRRHRARRGRGEKMLKRGGIKNRVSIRERPAEVDTREEPGHWEGDLILGAKHQSAIGVLVERSSRYTILIRTDNKEAQTISENFIRFLQKVPASLRRSLTYDNGSEMAYHENISQALGMKVYFADPRSPWQRGSNENTNSLVREFFPKGTDLSVHSQEHLGSVAALLNRRPRKVLAYISPAEVFGYMCENQNETLTRCLSLLK